MSWWFSPLQRPKKHSDVLGRLSIYLSCSGWQIKTPFRFIRCGSGVFIGVQIGNLQPWVWRRPRHFGYMLIEYLACSLCRLRRDRGVWQFQWGSEMNEYWVMRFAGVWRNDSSESIMMMMMLLCISTHLAVLMASIKLAPDAKSEYFVLIHRTWLTAH